MSQSPAQDLAVATAPHQVTMAFLGDTFAIHEVGERIAYAEVLPHLITLGEGKPRKRLTLLVSIQEFTERFGLSRRPAEEDASVVTLAPAVESALDILQQVLSEDDFGWMDCLFTAGLLEEEGQAPLREGELRILISPSGGLFTLPGNAPTLAAGTHHAVSNALAPEGCPIPDEEAAPVLVERSRSCDLLATSGLVAFLRRNPGVARNLSVDTIKQVAFEFPQVVDEGLLAP